MRPDIHVPDTAAEAAILSSVADQEAYILELLREDAKTKAADLGSASPNYAQILRDATRSPNRFKTREEIDIYISGLRSE